MRLLLALLFCTMAFGQGYDKTKWGMSETQVRSLYPEREFKTITAKGTPARPGEFFTKTDLAGVPVSCTFHFSGSGLDWVRLSAVEEWSPSQGASVVSKALISKYGPPARENRLERMWFTKDAVITEDRMLLDKTWVVTVRYTPRVTNGV